VSFFLVRNQSGQGPRLHHHPNDETVVILEGSVRVSGGDEVLDGGQSEIVIGPAGVRHGFTNLGPGPARLVCIHAAPAMTTQCSG
jgi:mannose-6-phosphate isomerase-like protein (cupin superfamily)